MRELRILVAIVGEAVETPCAINTHWPPGKFWGAIMETLLFKPVLKYIYVEDDDLMI